MKILIVNRALGTLFGGGESFDYNAARFLEVRGHNVTVVTGKPLWHTAPNQYADLKVVYLPTVNFRYAAYATERLSKKLSAFFYHLDNAIFEYLVLKWYKKQPAGKFDIVQCCSLFGLPKRLILKYCQPVVSWLPGPPSGVVRKRLSKLLHNPRFGLHTHGSSEWVLNEMCLYRGNDFECIEPGISLSEIDAITVNRVSKRAQLGLNTNDLVGITTARLVPIKNHLFLLQSLACAKQRGIVWHWIFIGAGPLSNELKERAIELGIENQIYFLGNKSQLEVHEWLAISDLFALTSTYENFSISALEAMAHQLPVIGTQVGYFQHLVIKANAGVVVESNNLDQLADALIMMTSSEVRRQYGQSGRRFVGQFDWPHVAEKLEKLFLKVINSNK